MALTGRLFYFLHPFGSEQYLFLSYRAHVHENIERSINQTKISWKFHIQNKKVIQNQIIHRMLLFDSQKNCTFLNMTETQAHYPYSHSTFMRESYFIQFIDFILKNNLCFHFINAIKYRCSASLC